MLFLALGIAVNAGLAAEPVTVLAPSAPSIPRPAGKKASADEVDVLIAMLRPYEYKGSDMDRPSFFAVLHYPERFDPRSMQPELRNLLGDVEEIRYLGQKAWGANVALTSPGLYEFVLEAKPWWNEDEQRYLHQQAKVIIPVAGGQDGWDHSFGQSFEILPLTRPFGLSSPAFFSARLLLDGKPLEGVRIRAGRINANRAEASDEWHKTLEARTDAGGNFGFVFNEPGWWYCEARIPGAPLKGPEGEMKELDRSTVLWVYVDAPFKGRK